MRFSTALFALFAFAAAQDSTTASSTAAATAAATVTATTATTTATKTATTTATKTASTDFQNQPAYLAGVLSFLFGAALI